MLRSCPALQIYLAARMLVFQKIHQHPWPKKRHPAVPPILLFSRNYMQQSDQDFTSNFDALANISSASDYDHLQHQGEVPIENLQEEDESFYSVLRAQWNNNNNNNSVLYDSISSGPPNSK